MIKSLLKYVDFFFSPKGATTYNDIILTKYADFFPRTQRCGYI